MYHRYGSSTELDRSREHHKTDSRYIKQRCLPSLKPWLKNMCNDRLATTTNDHWTPIGICENCYGPTVIHTNHGYWTNHHWTTWIMAPNGGSSQGPQLVISSRHESVGYGTLAEGAEGPSCEVMNHPLAMTSNHLALKCTHLQWWGLRSSSQKMVSGRLMIVTKLIITINWIKLVNLNLYLVGGFNPFKKHVLVNEPTISVNYWGNSTYLKPPTRNLYPLKVGAKSSLKSPNLFNHH